MLRELLEPVPTAVRVATRLATRAEWWSSDPAPARAEGAHPPAARRVAFFLRRSGEGGAEVAMLCSEVMRQRVECLSVDDPVQAAARRMKKNNLGFLPVCDGQLRVLGTVTDRDIAVRVVAEGLPPSTPVGEIMATDFATCRPGADIRTAERIMGENHNERILVVDEMQRLSGIICLADVARYEDTSRIALTFRQITERAPEL